MDKIILSSLEEILNKKHHSLMAQRRLRRDLTAVYERINKGEYETSSIVSNLFDVPDKTNQFFRHLSTYSQIGSAWSAIINQFPIHKYPNVLDICPGFAPKVEIGLFYSSYRGIVSVMDNNSASIKTLKNIIQIFHPQFVIQPIVKDIFKNKKPYSFVTGNHVIDDLVLGYFCQEFNLTLDNLYESENKLLHTWRQILKNKEENSRKVSEKIVLAMDKLVAPGGYLLLTEYQSYLEKMLSMSNSYHFCLKVFNLVIDKLTNTSFVRQKIGNGVLNSRSYFGYKNVAILKKVGR